MSYKTKHVRHIDISNKQKAELENILPLIEKFYEKVPKKCHVLIKSTGEELSITSAIKWLNSYLKSLILIVKIILSLICLGSIT
jgi:phage-related minor tail protein